MIDRAFIHNTTNCRHSQQTFFRIIARVFVFILFTLITTTSFAQDIADNPTIVSPWLQNMNKRRPMVFRNDTIMVKPRWFIPDHLKVQYAGNIGFMSIGAGYNVNKRYEPTLYFGLLNETLGDSYTTVTTVSLKNSFKLFSRPVWNHFYPKIGLSVNWGHTNNTFNKLPEHYPNKYYFQNKVHLAPFIGGEWQQSIKDKHLKAIGLYVEMATLDAYLLECIRTRYVSITDIWNIAVGASFYIH